MCYWDDSNIFFHIMLKFSDYEPFTLKGLIMEMEWFFCIANMTLDSELLLIIILLSIISWPLVPVSHLDTHCIVVVFRAYAWASRHVYINLHPASSVWKQHTVAQPFQTSFCPQTKNENKLHLKYIHSLMMAYEVYPFSLKTKKTNCKKTAT